MDTGEGGLSPYHLEGGCDVIMQIGTAKYGIRDLDGKFASERTKELAPHVKAFEIKLSQGAKPGKGGILPGGKVTEEIARIRGIPAAGFHQPEPSPDIANIDELLDLVVRLRELSGVRWASRPPSAAGNSCTTCARPCCGAALEYAPDFLTIDGGEGGSGAAPQALADHMSLPIAEALPRVVERLIEAGLSSRIKLVASGKLVTSAHAAWALCVGADFINTARGFMFALGCIQALRCHTNTCPTGITTHNKRLQRGLVVDEKYLRVAQLRAAT